MLLVGSLGLMVNLVALVLLRAGAGESLNVKGAYLEVVADTLGSVGVIVAGLLVAWPGEASTCPWAWTSPTSSATCRTSTA